MLNLQLAVIIFPFYQINHYIRNGFNDNIQGSLQ